MKRDRKIILFGAGFFVVSALIFSINSEYLSTEGGRQFIINHTIKTVPEAKSAEQDKNGELKLKP